MIDLVGVALWLAIVLPSPHPVVGLICGPIVYWAVTQRLHWISKGWRWWW